MSFINVLKTLIMIAIMLVMGLLQEDLYAQKMLSHADLDLLSQMLAAQDLTLEHMAFDRDWDPGCEAKSSWHLNMLSGGIEAVDSLESLRDCLTNSQDPELLKYFSNIAKECNLQNVELPSTKITTDKAFFRYVENCLDLIYPVYRNTFLPLNNAQQDSLAAFLMQMMLEEEDAEQYQEYFTRQNLMWQEEIEIDPYLSMIEELDFSALASATLAMMNLRDIVTEYNPRTKRSKVYKSKYGLMIIGTKSADVYNEQNIKELAKLSPCLILDPGGDDIYDLELMANREQPFLLLIDKDGNDLYRSKEPSLCALNGIYLGHDCSGDDVYQLGDFAFSAIMGTVWHTDTNGNDIYQSGVFSQGAAILGMAMLKDKAGNDSYSAHSMAQAFGSTYGVGILADFEGSDTYYLGGRYFHAPLMPKDFRTMGQGMGFGIRPYLGGGLGFLFDKAGNDKYLGGVYAQGTGYWYATGILMDLDGNDVYNAVYYPQGSGIHLASGILHDASGNDCYYSRNGPGQGAGHDYGFGMLIDSEGDDAYSIHGGNGLGISNSLGLFVDLKGNDRYERNEAQNYGSANFSRNAGGLGLFLDAGGNDLYPDSIMTNNSDWQKGTYGFGKDVNMYSPEDETPTEEQEQLPAPAEDDPIADIFAAASEWEVGNSINRVRKAREIMISRPNETIEYIINNKLANNSGLEYRALQVMCNADSLFCTKLLDYTNDPDSLKAKTAISLLAGKRDSRLLPVLSEHLAAKRYVSTCIASLGNIEGEESLQMLLAQRNQNNERLRFLVVRSLSLHSGEAAQAALKSFEQDSSFLIQSLLRNLPKDE
ncbi:MAG: HEAT repeat domain-containing protein [Candidatus Cloacimonetes bacterium]|nr:HEAT repeat domain-containing protein [Candidatus Cloacimonadota bacterium]